MTTHFRFKISYLSFLFGVLCQLAYSQRSADLDQTVIFNGRLVDGHGKAIQGVEVILKCKDETGISWLNPPSNRKITRSSGEFQVVMERALYNRIRKIKIETDNQWKIIYPKDGEDDPRKDVDGEMFLITFTCEKIESASAKLTEENRLLTQQIKLFADTVNVLKSQIHVSEKYRDSLVAKLALVENEKKLAESKQIGILDTIKSNLRDNILTSLDTYLDDLKNLDQFITPKNIKDSFIYSRTRAKLEQLVDKYNDSRAFIAKVEGSYLSGVQEYWGPTQRIILSDVYTFALVDINKDILVDQLNMKVIERIDAVVKQEQPRMLLQPKAVRAAKEIDSILSHKLVVFLEKTETLKQAFLDN
jgi:hypothetical protein